MKRRTNKPVDDLTCAAIAEVERLMSERGISRKELAFRMKMRPNNLGRYMDPGTNGYGPWRLALIRRFVEGLGISLEDFTEAVIRRVAGAAWDPTSQAAAELVATCEPHEANAKEGLGFFREFACPVLLPEIRRQVNLYWFSGFGPIGERMRQAYDDVADFYDAEYTQCGGHYGDYELTSIILRSDVERFIRGEDEFSGCTAELRQLCLDRLRQHHVLTLGYRIGFVEDDRVPVEVLYDLANANSLIAIGTTLTLRRQMCTFQICCETQSQRVQKSLRHLRLLKSSVDHDLTASGIAKRIESFQREADRMNRPGTKIHPSNKKGSRLLDFLGNEQASS